MWLSTVHVERTLYGKSKLGWVTTCCRQPNSEPCYLFHATILSCFFYPLYWGKSGPDKSYFWFKKVCDITHYCVISRTFCFFVNTERFAGHHFMMSGLRIFKKSARRGCPQYTLTDHLMENQWLGFDGCCQLNTACQILFIARYYLIPAIF